MNPKTEKLREIARDLLSTGEVKQVIGHRRGTEGHRSAPLFAETPEDCEALIFDPTCTQNLVQYLRKLPEKAAVVVKGCDARAIAVLLSEQQLNRDMIHIIGVPCEGLVDIKKLARAEGVNVDDITDVQVDGNEVVVTMGEREVRVPADDVIYDQCLGCQCPTPPVYDDLLGEEIGARDPEKAEAIVRMIEAMTPEEREEYFKEQFSRCLRCFACVRACPMCYCTTCFAIQDKPQYLPRTVGFDQNRMFHMGRALHLAGRCVGCGACDRACPVDIPLRALNMKMAEETKALFDCVAGFACDNKPPLVEFLPGDTEKALDTH